MMFEVPVQKMQKIAEAIRVSSLNVFLILCFSVKSFMVVSIISTKEKRLLNIET